MDKLSSKYTPRLRTDDDAFTEPSGRTNADLSIRCVRRGEAHHINSDFSELSASLLLAIHAPIDSIQCIILDFKAVQSDKVQAAYT